MTKDRLFWKEKFQGEEHESTYAIVTKENESVVEWQSLTGRENYGNVRCEAKPGGETCITLTIHYNADDSLHLTTAVRRRHQDLLDAFKKHVESKVARGAASTSPVRSKPYEVKV